LTERVSWHHTAQPGVSAPEINGPVVQQELTFLLRETCFFHMLRGDVRFERRFVLPLHVKQEQRRIFRLLRYAIVIVPRVMLVRNA